MSQASEDDYDAGIAFTATGAVAILGWDALTDDGASPVSALWTGDSATSLSRLSTGVGVPVSGDSVLLFGLRGAQSDQSDVAIWRGDRADGYSPDYSTSASRTAIRETPSVMSESEVAYDRRR